MIGNCVPGHVDGPRLEKLAMVYGGEWIVAPTENALYGVDARSAGLRSDELMFGQTADGIDEIFVLSDGEPSVGEAVSAAGIVGRVEEINRYQRVRIHCVFVGGGKGRALLEQLAESNDGMFLAR